MNPLHHNTHTRRGVTLVELMVVVTILMLLAAFAIPVMRPLTEGRRLREAARAADVLFTQAKTRAIVNQRPVGILLERFQQVDTSGNVVYQDDACNILRIVDIPSPYAGDLLDSRVRIQNWTTLSDGSDHPLVAQGFVVLKLAVQVSTLRDGVLRRGDQVQFGFQGPLFTIIDDPADNPGDGTSGNDFPEVNGYIVFSGGTRANTNDNFIDSHVLTVTIPEGQLGAIPWPQTASAVPDTVTVYSGRALWSADTTFQFFRQPEPAPIEPLRLPKGTVIDLADSGYPTSTIPDGNQFGIIAATLSPPPDKASEHRGPMILFAPNGSISDVYHWDAAGSNYTSNEVLVPVFLMIGKLDRTGATPLADDGLHNWQDATNIWMAVGPQNGFVTTANVDTRYLDDNGTPADPTDDALVDNVNADGISVPPTMFDSRRFAREAQVSKGAISE